jgi:putative tricarboxylic transport membrane protein
MKYLNKVSVWLLVILFVVIGVGNVLAASNFPDKPVTLVVHAGAGGGSDIFARTLAAAVEKEKLLPKPLVVENKPGGSGGIAFA